MLKHLQTLSLSKHQIYFACVSKTAYLHHFDCSKSFCLSMLSQTHFPKSSFANWLNYLILAETALSVEVLPFTDIQALLIFQILEVLAVKLNSFLIEQTHFSKFGISFRLVRALNHVLSEWRFVAESVWRLRVTISNDVEFMDCWLDCFFCGIHEIESYNRIVLFDTLSKSWTKNKLLSFCLEYKHNLRLAA